MSASECPSCGLFNPEGADRCDCGYDLRDRPPIGKVSVVQRHPWAVWFGVLIVGLSVFSLWDLGFDSAGPPGVFVLAVGYPIFLVAIRKAWTRHLTLAVMAMSLHFVVSIVSFGTLEASMSGHGLAALVTCLVSLLTSFVYPVMGGARSQPPRVRTRVLPWAVALLILVVVTPGLVLSASEFAQANAFRKFCLDGVANESLESARQLMEARFIRTAPAVGGAEISSHGRGCLVVERDGKLAVLQLLPRRGFPWALDAIPGAGLRGLGIEPVAGAGANDDRTP
jgi:hypothetical protein